MTHDLANQNIMLTRQHELERVRWRIVQLMHPPVYAQLSHWKKQFTASIYEQMEGGKTNFSTNQVMKVLEVWGDAHREGWVELPKGAV